MSAIPVPQGTAFDTHAAMANYFDVLATDPRFAAASSTPKGDRFGLYWQDYKDFWQDLPAQLPELPSFMTGDVKGQRKDTSKRKASDNGNANKKKKKNKKKPQAIPDADILVRSRGAFYLEERQVLYFTLNGGAAATVADDQTGGAPTIYINGEALSPPTFEDEDDVPVGPIEMPIELAKGVHHIDMVAVVPASAGKSLSAEVLVRSAQETDAQPLAHSSFFNADQQPELLAETLVSPANVTFDQGSNTFELDLVGVSSRIVRLVMLDSKGGEPAINAITMNDAAGERVLPTEKDYREFRQNDILEVGPSDRISITYEDGSPFNPSNDVHEAFMSANYFNASVSPVFAQFVPQPNGTTKEMFGTLRRFDAGDPIRVNITDFDADISADVDQISYTVRTSSGEEISLTAPETSENSGVFIGSFFPVDGDPARPEEIRLRSGDDVLINYRDEENTDPGIPWVREAILEQTFWADPQMRVFSSFPERLTDEEIAAYEASLVDAKPTKPVEGIEIPKHYRLVYERPSDSLPIDGVADTCPIDLRSGSQG